MDTNSHKKIPVKHECKRWYFWLEIDLPEGRRKFISCAQPMSVHIEGFALIDVVKDKQLRSAVLDQNPESGVSLKEAIAIAKQNGKVL